MGENGGGDAGESGVGGEELGVEVVEAEEDYGDDAVVFVRRVSWWTVCVVLRDLRETDSECEDYTSLVLGFGV